MKHHLAFLAFMAFPAWAQQPNGTINPPIYATGYISQAGGTNVTTKIPPQPNHPANQNVYVTSAVTGTWTIQLPNPAFEGQVLSFNCGYNVSAISVSSSDGSSLDSSIPTTCNANSGFVVQFDQRSNIWRNLGSNSTALSGITVNNNTQLTALPSAITQATRLGYASAGDAPSILYTRNNSACSLNSGAGDGGSQVPTSDGKCWIASLPSPLDVRIWGAKADAVSDDGPAIRAAMSICTTQSKYRQIYLPNGRYVVNTLDSSGLGALVFGDGATQFTCAFVGEAVNPVLDVTPWLGGTSITLGNGLNRPLIYVQSYAGQVLFQNLYLDGNKAGQSGWAGGPSGKLFTVQVADGVASPEGAIALEHMRVTQGYNGNIYIGTNRGAVRFRDLYVTYGGQSTTDASVLINSYDVIADNLGIGSHSGIGLYVGSCIQCFFTNSAIWANNIGMIVAAPAKQIFGQSITFQANAINQLRVFGGEGSVSFVNASFQSGSYGSSGTNSDILSTDSTRLTLISPDFFGNDGYGGTGSTPKYNIEHSGTSLVNVVYPRYTAGTSATTAFTNNFAALRGSFSLKSAWTPTLVGATTAGTPTYTIQVGHYALSNNIATLTFIISTTNLGGAAGVMQVGGLPVSSTTATNAYGACSIAKWLGWTAGAGYTNLSMIVPPNTNKTQFLENGSGMSGTTSDASHFAATTQVIGTCSYAIDP